MWQVQKQNTTGAHVQRAAEHRGKPEILAYAPGEQFSVKWLVSML